MVLEPETCYVLPQICELCLATCKDAGQYRSRARGHNGSVDLILFRVFINDLPDNVN